ncbi:nickel insertion protein [Streptomyces sp. NPDC002676]
MNPSPSERQRGSDGRALPAVAEGRLHDADDPSVHPHEPGGRHTLVHIAGTAAALHPLGVTEVVAHRCRSAGPGRTSRRRPPALLTRAAASGTAADHPGSLQTCVCVPRASNSRVDLLRNRTPTRST